MSDEAETKRALAQPADQPIAEIMGLLAACVGQLDQLGLHAPAAHANQALEALRRIASNLPPSS